MILFLLFCVTGLLFSYFNSNVYYSKKIVKAIEKEDIETVKSIMEKKPDCVNTFPTKVPRWMYTIIDVSVRYPLNEACATGNIELIRLLLENGADVNCHDGRTPLSVTYHQKVENWYPISLLLIEYGASLDYTTDYSGEYSCILMDIVQVRPGSNAVDYVPESVDEVMSAFHYAIANCDYKEWEAFLAN